MTYKQIEGSREVRLWIGQVIVPAIGTAAIVLSNPDVKNQLTERIRSIKTKLRKN